MANCAVVTRVLDTTTRDGAAQSLRRAVTRLPSFAELADPSNMPRSRVAALHSVDPDRPDPANLFRVHWHNDRRRSGFAAIPPHLVLPSELTGVCSPILVALGCFFPMIAAHKVLAAYGCLIPYLVTGRFDPARAGPAGGQVVDGQAAGLGLPGPGPGPVEGLHRHAQNRPKRMAQMAPATTQ